MTSKKLLSTMLAAILALAMLPTPAFAALTTGTTTGTIAGTTTDTADETPAPAPKVVTTGTLGSCTWTLYETGELNIAATDGNTGMLDSWSNTPPWYNKRTSVKSVTFTGTVKATTCSGMFSDMTKLQSVDFKGFDTGWVSSFQSMFAGASALETIDLSTLNFSKATSIEDIFDSCTALQEVNLEGADLDRITSFPGVFRGRAKLKRVNLTGVRTAGLKSTENMFSGCSNLESVDLSSLNTANVTSMVGMFKGCASLKSVNLSNLNTAKVKSMSSMFSGCSSLESFSFEGLNTAKVTNMDSMFSGCTNLKSVDFTKAGTAAVKSFDNMFAESGLTSADLSNISFESATSLSGMFQGCVSLASVALPAAPPNASKMDSMFANCASLESIALPVRFINKATTLSSMFSNCTTLRTISATADTAIAAGTKSSKVFYGCIYLVGGKGTVYDPSHDAAYARIDDPDNDRPGYFTNSSVMIDSLTLALPAGGYTYDGKAKKPKVTVKAGEAILDAAAYEVTYSRNVNAGVATVSVRAAGAYSGTLTTTFTIKQAALPKAKIKYNKKVEFYGKKSWDLPDVTISGLKLGRDFTVTSSNNKKLGKATAVITGIGNYKGQARKAFRLVIARGDMYAYAGSTYGTVKAKVDKNAATKKHEIVINTKKSRSNPVAKVTVTGTSYTFKNLNLGTTYYVTERPVKKQNGKTTYGAWSTWNRVTTTNHNAIGTWDVVGMKDNSGSVTYSQMATLEKRGYKSCVTFRRNYTGVLTLLNSNYQFTWKPTAYKKGTIRYSDGGQATFSLEFGDYDYDLDEYDLMELTIREGDFVITAEY